METSAATPPARGGQSDRTLPGEEGVVMLVLGDMTIFALFFTTFMYYRSQAPALFDHSQARLNLAFGVVNTLLLLTSSWFVVGAVQAARALNAGRARVLLRLAIACGLGFVVVKVLEYGEKFRAGITVTTNDFFMFYFILTGIHFLHLLVGLGVLLFLHLRTYSLGPQRIQTFEGGGVFWHMVDLLWIVLFALIYLVK